MLKKVTVLLLAALMVIPLVLTVRGRGNDDKEGLPPVIINGITLSESITNKTSGITVRYPDGWVAKEDDTSVVIATTEDVLTTAKPSEGDMAFTVLPLTLESLQATDLDTAFKAVTAVLTGNPETTRGSETTVTTVAGQPARRMDVMDVNQGDTVILGWLSGENLVVAMGMAPMSKLAEIEPFALAMAETITFRK